VLTLAEASLKVTVSCVVVSDEMGRTQVADLCMFIGGALNSGKGYRKEAEKEEAKL